MFAPSGAGNGAADLPRRPFTLIRHGNGNAIRKPDRLKRPGMNGNLKALPILKAQAFANIFSQWAYIEL